MLMDMAHGIELELRDGLRERGLVDVALRIMRKAMEHGAYTFPPDWFNNDDNFARVMSETLYLQRTLINEVGRLDAAVDKTELSLRGWKARGPARIMLLAGWAHARTATADFAIDLRDAELTPNDGEQLAALLTRCPKLTAIDVRGNESLDERGSKALVNFLLSQKSSSTAGRMPRSILGVTPARSRLDVPKQMPRWELCLLCAELEANTFAEGVSAGMGGRALGTTQLNRRGANLAGEWMALVWAAKDNNVVVAQQLLENGYDVNKQEPFHDKGNSGYAPIHWACQKGHEEMCTMLIQHGAQIGLHDKHGNPPRTLAEKKGHKAIVAILDAARDGTLVANADRSREGQEANFSSAPNPAQRRSHIGAGRLSLGVAGLAPREQSGTPRGTPRGGPAKQVIGASEGGTPRTAGKQSGTPRQVGSASEGGTPRMAGTRPHTTPRASVPDVAAGAGARMALSGTAAGAAAAAPALSGDAAGGTPRRA